MREFFVPVSEMLFWFTGGELLINTWWIFVWVLAGSLVMVIPLWYTIQCSKRPNSVPGFIFIIGFFPTLFLVVSPGIIQMDMIQECRYVEAAITIEGNTEIKKVKQCRSKTNYYDDNYGEWGTVNDPY